MKSRLPFKLYLVGNRHQSLDRPLTQILREAAEGGISAFQFREKDLSLRAQFLLASELKIITKAYGIKLIINGRIDLCLALNADGVQLPVNGFPLPAARKLLGKHRLIGLSCHSEADVRKAYREGADFAVLGPVYDTPSKRQYGAALGLEAFRKIRERTSLPLFAIGGIKHSRLKAVFGAGADGVALISAISAAKDVSAACRDFLEKIEALSSEMRGTSEKF